MALIERLMNVEEPKIAVHGFMAALAERRRGRITNPQLGTILGVAPGSPDVAELVAIRDRILADTLTAAEVHDVLLLAERLAPGYDTPALIRTRLGI